MEVLIIQASPIISWKIINKARPYSTITQKKIMQSVHSGKTFYSYRKAKPEQKKWNTLPRNNAWKCGPQIYHSPDERKLKTLV